VETYNQHSFLSLTEKVGASKIGMGKQTNSAYYFV